MAHTLPRRAGGRAVLVALLLAGLASAAAVPATAAPRPAAAPSAVAAALVPAGPAAAAPALDPGLPLTGPDAQVVVTGDAHVADAVRAVGGRVGAAAAARRRRRRERPGRRGCGALAATRRRARRHRRPRRARSSSTPATRRPPPRPSPRPCRRPAWAGGNHGKGVGVAVLDTGVSPMPDLAGRLVHGPDLSGEGTVVDSYGHGTVMAGLIAGNGAARRTGHGAYTGVAPGAHVVAVKVAGRNGVVDVSTMLEAMHWVSAYRDAVRHPRAQPVVGHRLHAGRRRVDPLNHAVQRLWSQGIVVVVAAGNSGPRAGTITKPGDDPVVLTVGALNDHGDTDAANDDVPGWSSRGPTASRPARKPDLVAPGRTRRGAALPRLDGRGRQPQGAGRRRPTSRAPAPRRPPPSPPASSRCCWPPGRSSRPTRSRARSCRRRPRSRRQTRYAQGTGRMQLAAALSATPVGRGAGAAPRPARLARRQPWRAARRRRLRRRRRSRSAARSTSAASRGTARAWAGPAWTGDAWTGHDLEGQRPGRAAPGRASPGRTPRGTGRLEGRHLDLRQLVRLARRGPVTPDRAARRGRARRGRSTTGPAAPGSSREWTNGEWTGGRVRRGRRARRLPQRLLGHHARPRPHGAGRALHPRARTAGRAVSPVRHRDARARTAVRRHGAAARGRCSGSSARSGSPARCCSSSPWPASSHGPAPPPEPVPRPGAAHHPGYRRRPPSTCASATTWSVHVGRAEHRASAWPCCPADQLVLTSLAHRRGLPRDPPAAGEVGLNIGSLRRRAGARRARQPAVADPELGAAGSTRRWRCWPGRRRSGPGTSSPSSRRSPWRRAGRC